MKLNRENIINFLIDNFEFELNNERTRRKMIASLNNVFFYDNIAKFVDTTSDEEIDMGTISLMILYKGTHYNLLAFEQLFTKIERYRKLKEINKNV